MALRNVCAKANPDGCRVSVDVDVDNVGEPYNLEVTVSAAGSSLSSMFVVESRKSRLELTLHLREPPAAGASLLAEVTLLAGEEPVGSATVLVEPSPAQSPTG